MSSSPVLDIVYTACHNLPVEIIWDPQKQAKLKKIVLSPEEKKIERDFKNYKPTSRETKSRIEKIIEGGRKSRPISLRINVGDLNILKKKANKNGLPYQTMINVVIHKYVTDSYLDKDEINKYLKLKNTG